MLPPPSLLLLQNPIYPSHHHHHHHPLHSATSPPLSGISIKHTPQYPFLYNVPIGRRASTGIIEQHIDPFGFKTLANNNTPSPPPLRLFTEQSAPPSPPRPPPSTAPAQQSQFGSGGWSTSEQQQPSSSVPVSFGAAGSTLAMSGHTYDRRVSEPTLHLHSTTTSTSEATPASGSASTSGGGSSPTAHHHQHPYHQAYRRDSISIPPPPLLPVLYQQQQQPALHDIPSSPSRILHTHSAQSTVSGVSSVGGGYEHQRRGSGHSLTHTTSEEEDEGGMSGGEQHSQTSPLSPNSASKQYSFISLAHPHVRKRPRRRYDEIERLYACNFPGCAKSYGTLNHLNAHVSMQRHGTKRTPQEFKEMRKQWRRTKQRSDSSSGPTILPATPGQLPPPTVYHQEQRTRGPGMGLTVAIPEQQQQQQQQPPMQPFPSPYAYNNDPLQAWMAPASSSRPPPQQPPFAFTAQQHEYDAEISPLDRSARPGSSAGSVSPVQWRRHSSVSLSPVDERQQQQQQLHYPPHYPLTLQPTEFAPQGQGRLPPGSTLLTPLNPPPPPPPPHDNDDGGH